MFKARGTRVVGGIERDMFAALPPATQLPVGLPEDPTETPIAPEPAADELAAALGMPITTPELPANFRDRVMAAVAGDLAAIQEMRAIGDQVPPHMRMAFAEMVENLIEAD